MVPSVTPGSFAAPSRNATLSSAMRAAMRSRPIARCRQRSACTTTCSAGLTPGATAEPVSTRSIAYRGLAAIFSKSPERTLDAVNRRSFGRRFPREIAGPILAGGFFFGGGAVAIRSLIGQRFKPRLAAYPGPSLFVTGEYDLFFRPTERSFAEVATNPQRVLIRGATHLTNLDRPEAFSAAIREFALRIA